jgi:predicted transcriptional regulator
MDQSVPTAVSTIEKKIYTGLAARALKLLGSGATQAETSRALGITESQVSQWMAEKDFADEVTAIVKRTFADQSVIDENYNKVEKTLSDRLMKTCEFMFDPDKILRTLKFVNEAKRKIAPQENPSGGGNTTILGPVTLILPAPVAREFILNPNNEILGVNGQELSTISNKALEDLSKTIKNSKPQGDTKLKRIERLHGSGQQDPWSNL